jgi:hypothetical protein
MASEDAFAGATPTVELVLEVSDPSTGKSAGGVAVLRQRLNVDEAATYYSTDFPTGGIDVQVLDLNNNEIEENPITDPGAVSGLDYRFETRSYGDLTSGLDEVGAPVPRNQNLLAPWNFDGGDGGFRGGLASVSNVDAADIFAIHNTGEDKNFNGIEDGVCVVDPSIACFNFPTDPRCPGGGGCASIENLAGDGSFTSIHHNQKGGCGWQTRSENVCTGNDQRGCEDDSDCLGSCRRLGNEIVSTLEPCSTSCPNTSECGITTANPLAPCVTDDDCGNPVPLPGDCLSVPQSCVGSDGTCDTSGAAEAGGVLHTGRINDLDLISCDGGVGSRCEDFQVISSTNGQLLWWSLWLTPVIEKVDQSIGADGLPNSRVEITRWAWNQSIDLPDANVALSWELDTDVDAIFPVDLVRDAEALGLLYGPFGPVSNAGPPPVVGEFGLFAPMASCSGSGGACQRDTDCPPGGCSSDASTPCHVDAECSSLGLGLCIGAEVCVQSDTSVNGADPQGNNRSGQNGCFFEGPGTIPAGARDELSLAQPPDDDLDNDTDGLIDEFVTAAGPIRNTDVSALGGPDLRLDLLEDLYGPTGNRFRAAIGMVNLEGSPATPASTGYGVAIDDMVLEWRELTLGEDLTTCSGTGPCATLDVPAANLFEGTTGLEITLLEPTPYNQACKDGPQAGLLCYSEADCPGSTCEDTNNDCDLNGRFNDPGDDDDCDDDGRPDVVVRAFSPTTGDAVILALNRQLPGNSLYRGELTTSTVADGPDLLFLQKNGALDPEVVATYLDLEDGTGQPCQNDALPERRGRVEASATIHLRDCDLSITSTTLSDNGDGDGFADTDEIVDLDFTLRNHCGIELNDCSAQLSTDSEWIECVRKPQVLLGDLPAGGVEVASPDFFQFKVDPSADRVLQGLGPLDRFEARFRVTLSCRELDTPRAPQEIVLPLDLNVNDGGQVPMTWFEGFESATLGQFTAENLDQGIPGDGDPEGLLNGDGWRCQYSDPDWINSGVFRTDRARDCYPGVTQAQADAVFWQVDGATISGSPDGGRAKSGAHSIYYGAFLSFSEGFTTPTGVVESVRSDPINLGVGSPRLSFWHQVSLADHRLLDGLPALQSADRAVVQVQLADDAGNPVGDWISVVPVQNAYDQQAARGLDLCSFDPIDDGDVEDDFFDPTDPLRDLGPSSTCFPAFSFGHLGDTDDTFDTTNVGNATTRPAPADQGSLGIGTWVESVVDLSRFRGQRARIRFLVSAARGSKETWQEQLRINPDGRDDGWWIDDVAVDEVLANPAQLANDDFTLGTCSVSGTPCIGLCEFSLLPCQNSGQCGVSEDCVAPCPGGETCSNGPEGCGANCTSAVANVVVQPGDAVNPSSISVPAPEWPISLDASPSAADACLDGTLQFRFCVSADADCEDEEDMLLRGWTENAQLALTPLVTTQLAVEVRCSSEPSCRGARLLPVEVSCPGEEENVLSLVQIRAVDKNTLSWAGDALNIDVWTSIALTSSGQLGGDIDTGYPGSFTDYVGATSIPMSESPSAGEIHYYLAKRRMELETIEGRYFCNSKTWRSGGTSEIPEDPESFGDGRPESPIGRDRKLANAIWGTTSAPEKKATKTADERDAERRGPGRRGG